jgi:hypothetical protein
VHLILAPKHQTLEGMITFDQDRHSPHSGLQADSDHIRTMPP